MSLIEVNWSPNRRQLKGFGIIALIASAVISVLLYLLKGVPLYWVFVVFILGLIIFISSFLYIKLTRIIYVGMTAATFPIGYIVGFVLLAGFYFLVLTPIGIIFSLIGRDPLCRRFDSNKKSYWLEHKLPESLERYFQQF